MFFCYAREEWRNDWVHSTIHPFLSRLLDRNSRKTALLFSWKGVGKGREEVLLFFEPFS